MNKRLKYSLWVCLLFSLTIGASAEGTSDEQSSFESRILVQFPINRSDIDPDYKDNHYAIEELKRFLATIDISKVDSISIVGSASPDGSASLNRQLARTRAESLSIFIAKQFEIDLSKLYLKVNGDTWSEMLSLIRRDTNFPQKDHTLIILENDVPYKQRLGTLRLLEYRESHSYLRTNIYPQLRNAMAIVIYYKADEQFVVYDNQADYLTRDPFVSAPKQAPSLMDTEPKSLSKVDSIYVSHRFQPKPIISQRPILAIKTNLLYDAVSALNVEFEVPIGNHWSVLAEVIAPWWLLPKEEICLQVFSAHVEGRYWFDAHDEQSRLKGWFAGVSVGAGYYDVEWRGRGYQGENLLSLGLTVGFAHSIGKYLRMEYSLGLGYMNTHYREYRAGADRSGVWGLDFVRNGEKTWIGPTKAKVSLVWIINKKDK